MLNFKFRTSLISTPMCQMFYVHLDSVRASGIFIFYLCQETNNGRISCKDSSGSLSHRRKRTFFTARYDTVLEVECFSFHDVLECPAFLIHLNCASSRVTSFFLHIGPAFSSFNRETSLETHRTWMRTFCLFYKSKVIFRKVQVRKSPPKAARKFCGFSMGRGGVKQNFENRTVPNGAGGG